MAVQNMKHFHKKNKIYWTHTVQRVVENKVYYLGVVGYARALGLPSGALNRPGYV